VTTQLQLINIIIIVTCTAYLENKTERGVTINVCLSFHVNYPLFLSYFEEKYIFPTYFEKSSNAKFNENLSNGSRVPHEQLYKRADMTKLIVAFRNFANAPKKITKLSVDIIHRHSLAYAVS